MPPLCCCFGGRLGQASLQPGSPPPAQPAKWASQVGDNLCVHELYGSSVAAASQLSADKIPSFAACVQDGKTVKSGDEEHSFGRGSAYVCTSTQEARRLQAPSGPLSVCKPLTSAESFRAPQAPIAVSCAGARLATEGDLAAAVPVEATGPCSARPVPPSTICCTLPPASAGQLTAELSELLYIGQGATGLVYRASVTQLSCAGMEAPIPLEPLSVAVKFTICNTPQQLWQRAKEALLSKLISHPNLVCTLAMDITLVTPNTFREWASRHSATFNISAVAMVSNQSRAGGANVASVPTAATPPGANAAVTATGTATATAAATGAGNPSRCGDDFHTILTDGGREHRLPHRLTHCNPLAPGHVQQTTSVRQLRGMHPLTSVTSPVCTIPFAGAVGPPPLPYPASPSRSEVPLLTQLPLLGDFQGIPGHALGYVMAAPTSAQGGGGGMLPGSFRVGGGAASAAAPGSPYCESPCTMEQSEVWQGRCELSPGGSSSAAGSKTVSAALVRHWADPPACGKAGSERKATALRMPLSAGPGSQAPGCGGGDGDSNASRANYSDASAYTRSACCDGEDVKQVEERSAAFHQPGLGVAGRGSRIADGGPPPPAGDSTAVREATVAASAKAPAPADCVAAAAALAAEKAVGGDTGFVAGLSFAASLTMPRPPSLSQSPPASASHAMVPEGLRGNDGAPPPQQPVKPTAWMGQATGAAVVPTAALSGLQVPYTCTTQDLMLDSPCGVGQCGGCDGVTMGSGTGTTAAACGGCQVGVEGGGGGGAPHASPVPFQDILYHMDAQPGRFLAKVIMEYCDSGTLLQRINAGDYVAHPDKGTLAMLSCTRALLWCLQQVAAGMAHLHSLNIVHGDLKPGNVLLTTEAGSPFGYVCKVSDFGLATALDASEQTITHESWGTVVYMAPESCAGRCRKASDVYSFGVLLWHMCTGARPFMGLQAGQVLLGVKTGSLKLKWPTWTSKSLVKVGQACLRFDPKERPGFKGIRSALLELSARIDSKIAAVEAAWMYEGAGLLQTGVLSSAGLPMQGGDGGGGGGGGGTTRAAGSEAVAAEGEEEEGRGTVGGGGGAVPGR